MVDIKMHYSSVLGRVLAISSLNDELRVFIFYLITTESKLDSTIHVNQLYLPGFEVVRRDHRVNGRKGGGVSIYLHTNLHISKYEMI